jgi:HAMP domain-containing protein
MLETFPEMKAARDREAHLITTTRGLINCLPHTPEETAARMAYHSPEHLTPAGRISSPQPEPVTQTEPMIDIQKLLDSLPEETREEVEAFEEDFERLVRKLIDAQPTEEAKEEMLAEIGRMVDEFERRHSPH